MTQSWAWLALAGLGAFHGLNPAMGWLFAVALGLHRRSRATVYLSLLPIAIGHALSVGAAAAAFVWAGFVLDVRALSVAAGLLLVGWAVYHWRYGHGHRVRVGIDRGQGPMDAMATGFPRLHFSRTTLVETALRNWTSERLLRVIGQLGNAALDSRQRSTLATAVAQRALLAVASAGRGRG